MLKVTFLQCCIASTLADQMVVALFKQGGLEGVLQLQRDHTQQLSWESVCQCSGKEICSRPSDSGGRLNPLVVEHWTGSGSL